MVPTAQGRQFFSLPAALFRYLFLIDGQPSHLPGAQNHPISLFMMPTHFAETCLAKMALKISGSE
jgi:hypothetical protein